MSNETSWEKYPHAADVLPEDLTDPRHTRQESDAYEKMVLRQMPVTHSHGQHSDHTHDDYPSHQQPIDNEVIKQPAWVTELPEDISFTSPSETAAYWYAEAQHQKGKQGSLARMVKELSEEAEARTEELAELKIYVRARYKGVHDVESSLRDQLRKEEAKTAEFVAMLREAAPAAFVAGTSEIDAARHVIETVRDAARAFMPVLANMWAALEGNLRAAGFDIDKYMKGRS